jgi:hypothetical protein
MAPPIRYAFMEVRPPPFDREGARPPMLAVD